MNGAKFKGQKYRIEIPTISDTAAAYKIVEKGYCQIDTDTRTELLAGLQDQTLQSVAVPGTTVALSMLKRNIKLTVPGKDWVEYEIEWQEPVQDAATFSGVGVVQNVTDQIGPTPARAMLTLTGKTIPASPYAKGATVAISHRGATIFRGWVTDLTYSASTGQSGTVVITAQDIRWVMQGIYVGGRNTLNASYKADDLMEVVFNRGGLPNKDPKALKFKQGAPDAVMWTYQTAIQALMTWYNAESLWSLSTTFLSDMPHKAVQLPETNLTNQTLSSAFDALVTAGAEASWRINFASATPKIESVTDANALRTLNYRTAAISSQYATECHINESVASGFKDFEIHSRRILLESFWDQDEWAQETMKGSDIGFIYVFRLKPDGITDRLASFTGLGWNGTAYGANDRAPRFSPNLVTRKQVDGDQHYWTKAEITDLVLATDSQPLDPYIWVSVDDGVTYYFAASGYQIDFENGRIFIGEYNDTTTPSFQAVNGTETEPVYITDSTKLKIKVTIAVELDWRQHDTIDFDGFTWPMKRTRVINDDKIAAEYRIWTRTWTDAGLHPPSAQLADNGEKYVDPTTPLASIKAQIYNQNPGVLYNGGIACPFAPLVLPGDRISVTNFTKWPSEIMFATRISYTLDKGKLRADLSCSNQFWAENAHLINDPRISRHLATKIQLQYLEGYRRVGG